MDRWEGVWSQVRGNWESGAGVVGWNWETRTEKKRVKIEKN